MCSSIIKPTALVHNFKRETCLEKPSAQQLKQTELRMAQLQRTLAQVGNERCILRMIDVHMQKERNVELLVVGRVLIGVVWL